MNIANLLGGKVPLVYLQYKKVHCFQKKYTIEKPKDTVKILRSVINPNTLGLKEYSWIILLSKNNTVLGISEVSIGDFNRVLINIREIVQIALLSNAARVILVHNHTSDFNYPSTDDLLITEKVKQALDLFEIMLLDDIILTSDDYYSSNDNGVL